MQIGLPILLLTSLLRQASSYEAKLEITSYPLAFTQITINGVPAKAMIDTGSFRKVQISGTLAKKLNLKLEPTGVKMSRIDGTVLELMKGKTESFTMGNYSASGIDADVTEGDIERVAAQINTPYDVIVGWGFLSKYFVTIDYRGKRLAFSEAAPTETEGLTVPFKTFHGAPLIDAEVDGKSMKALVDTGAPTCNLDMPLTKGNQNNLETHSLKAGPLSLDIEFRPRNLDPIKQGLGAEAVLGNNLIGRYIVYIDPQKGAMRFGSPG